MPPIHAADRPALSTIPNVEIIEVGTWATSTGVFAVSQNDLFCAVAAYDDPGYTTPVVKLGHVDPRFDGEPALGRLINPRLSDDGMTMIVDIAGVPTWLADIAASAFPRRSIEGEFGHTTQTGSKHKFALTALSLLGVQAPAISTLADIALLYGLDPVVVAASAADSLAADPPEDPMPEPDATGAPVRVSASVNLDKVRQSFYADDDTARKLRGEVGGWPWVREVYNDFLVVDDDEGSLFRIPWSEDAAKPGEVAWGEPSKVRVEYVAASAGDPDTALRRGALRSRLAAMGTADPAPDRPDVAATVLDSPSPLEGQPPNPILPVGPAPPAEPPGPDEESPTPPDEGGVPVSGEPGTTSPGAEPVTNELEGDRPVSTLSADVRSRLGLADDADEAAILAALDALKSKADAPPEPSPEAVAASAASEKEKDELRKEVSVLASQMQTVTTELAAAKAKAAADIKASVLDAASKAGKFAPADREQWSADYDEAPAAVTRVLASIAPGTAVPVLAAGYTGTGEETGESFDDAEYQRLFGEKAGA